MLVLLWEEELHDGGGVSTLGMKVDADSSKLTVERKRLRKNQSCVQLRFGQTGWLRHSVCRT